MAKLCFDYGHGGTDPGAVYQGRREKDDVLSLGKAVAKELRRHGVIVDETRTGDNTVSLRDRSNFENRKAMITSYPFTAMLLNQNRQGVETYTYLNAGAKAKGLANKIQTALVGIGFANRGVKEANFHVLRETKAPAVLVEIGFIDNSSDNQIFDTKRNEIIKAITIAILSQLGIKYIPSTPPPTGQTLYRVMVGSFRQRENAEKQVQKLKAAGFDATIMIFNK